MTQLHIHLLQTLFLQVFIKQLQKTLLVALNLQRKIIFDYNFSLGINTPPGDYIELYLANLHSTRDWGHAKDYTEMQWKILQQNKLIYEDQLKRALDEDGQRASTYITPQSFYPNGI